MGTCFAGKPKVDKNLSKKYEVEDLFSQGSEYEIFKVNLSFKNHFEIKTNQLDIKEGKIDEFGCDLEEKGTSRNDSFIGQVNELKRKSYSRRKRSCNIDKPQTDSSAATNGSKFTIDAVSPHSPKLIKSYSESFGFFAKKENERRPDSIEIPHNNFNQFAPEEFLFKSYLNSLQENKEIWFSKKPKRLSTFHHNGHFYSHKGKMQFNNVNTIAEVPSMNEIHDLPDDYVINSPESAYPAKEEFLNKKKYHRKKGFNKSISSYELESLDLSVKKGMLKIFFVPFVKTSTEKIDYKLKEITFNEFDYFYKSPYATDEESLRLKSNIFKAFPTRWPRGEVPFIIHSSLMFVVTPKNDTLYNVVVRAVYEVSNSTIIKFISYSPKKHQDFIQFTLGNENSSFLGRHSGKNSIYLNNKSDLSSVLHQIMHCLGFMHQHLKSNNEGFVYIAPHQLKHSNFLDKNQQVCIAGLENGPYDFSSVLNFKSCENMISYRIDHDGEVLNLSKVDIEKINFFYSPDFPDNEAKTYEKLAEIKKISEMWNEDVIYRKNSFRRKISINYN